MCHQNSDVCLVVIVIAVIVIIIDIDIAIGQIDRAGRLNGRNRVFVGQLHRAVAFQQHAEQIVSRDPPLQHDAIDEEHRYLDLGLAHTAQEHVLQLPLTRVAGAAAQAFA